MKAGKYTYKGNFEFEAGGALQTIEIAYHCSERDYVPGDGRKVIWICHALTANSDAQDWWPELVGPGKLFDTEKYYVVCANMLGSCYGSSGPSSINPETGRPYFLDFPKVTVRDIVHSLDLLRIHLGIEKIDFLVGASIGGFQAIEWCILRPEVISRASFIATHARVNPYLTAYEESQRMALLADRSFLEAKSLEGGRKGLECARSIALISYRSEEGYNSRQQEESDDTLFADRAGSYQRYQGKKLADRFDAYSYWSLSFSVDSNNAGRGRGGLAKALAGIRAEATVIAIDSDLLFTPKSMREMAEMIPGAQFIEIGSRFGHDGFLLEHQQIEAILRPIIDNL